MTPNEEEPSSRAPGQPNEVDSPDHGVPSPDLASFFSILAASFTHSQGRSGARSAGEAASKKAQLRGSSLQPAQRFWPRPILLAALLCVGLAWMAPLLLAPRELVVPDTLVGSWRTSARLYSDRGFTITKTSLVLKAGPDRSNVSVHPIARLRIARSGDSPVYTIEYLVERAPYEFSFRVSPGPPPVISLVHQPAVTWRKEDDSFSPSARPVHRR